MDPGIEVAGTENTTLSETEPATEKSSSLELKFIGLAVLAFLMLLLISYLFNRNSAPTSEGRSSTPVSPAFSNGYDRGFIFGNLDGENGLGVPSQYKLESEADRAVTYNCPYTSHEEVKQWKAGYATGYAAGFKSGAERDRPAF